MAVIQFLVFCNAISVSVVCSLNTFLFACSFFSSNATLNICNLFRAPPTGDLRAVKVQQCVGVSGVSQCQWCQSVSVGVSGCQWRQWAFTGMENVFFQQHYIIFL